MLHPANIFTVEQADAFNAEVNSKLDKHRASLLTPRPKPQELPVITYANCYEARDARHAFEEQPDAEKNLADAHEEQFDLCELIRSMEAILASNPTEHERRKLEGYEAKDTPSLPGILDTYHHVDGNLDRCRADLASLEAKLPRLEYEAARYLQVKKSLAPWSWVRINRERNADFTPLKFPPNLRSLPEAEQLKCANRAIFTKFNGWEYEKEIRIWALLSNEEDGLHFLEFEERMRLVEVIIGASCTLTRAAITRALGTLASEVKITRARAAYDGFRMVEDERADSDR